MNLKEWPIEERPREKLLSHGANALSNAELLAIILRTGTHGKNVVELARNMISEFGNLKGVFNSDIDNFCQLPGLGPAKYVQFQAMLEIIQRYLNENISNKHFLSSPDETRSFLIAKLKGAQKEIFGCLFLDNKNHIISFEELFHGTINETKIYPRELIKRAFYNNAAACIFVHNHPSGNPTPSQEDIDITQKLRKTFSIFDIRILDHFIISDTQAVSLAELGHL
ncbi:MAG: DNA repair protein RadC [Methylococcales bacterium]|jgi:DNA repair protein RadC|nr:DNA repair protein RadC [Methylococcales bacterium]MBT7409336.1 DNA repair protein RadC [Methylococcales bacterium]